TDVPVDTTLAWTPGETAAAHDVYLGIVFADVNEAGRDSAGLLVSQEQADAQYSPQEPLVYGTTYYWRIDEINAAPDFTVFKGTTWSFTTEPYGYPIANVTATASGSQPGMGPENTVNNSGLDDMDQHSTESTDMWTSDGVKPTWIQFEFDAVYTLHELWVWNSNQLIEGFLGFGAKDVTVEYSLDGQTWTTLEGVPQFARGTGLPTYTANTTVAFNSVTARYVKLTIEANWGGAVPSTGLSEVRFFYVPVQAFRPQPADGATEVSIDAGLSWRPGRMATSHAVRVGTDETAVAEGTMPAETVAGHSFSPGTMNLATEYFWKVDESGNSGAYTGVVWSFTTQEFAAIDDFESYNDNVDAGTAIWQAWVDGVTTKASGSQVGYTESPFAERAIVHGGRQSMPLLYDNSASPYYSEAERTFDSPQDWTAHGADTLCVYFQGAAANSSEGLYATLKDNSKSATVAYAGAATTTTAEWQRWTIPLSDFTGVKATAVKALVIGVGNRAAPASGGTGTIYIDDIGYGRLLPSP
ncbi:MAG: discoidin domain-containing protein, partial [Solirubrobacterales bacterium]